MHYMYKEKKTENRAILRIILKNHIYSQISKFIPNYWYLKVNFLEPENLLWGSSSLRQKKLKWKLKKEMSPTIFLNMRVLWDISVWAIESWLYFWVKTYIVTYCLGEAVQIRGRGSVYVYIWKSCLVISPCKILDFPTAKVLLLRSSVKFVH